MKAARGRRGLLLQTSKQRHLATKMVWPFSSSNNAQAAEEPQQERSGYECAPYTVLETAADYQVRRYPSMKWATVTMIRSPQTPNKSFMKLFGYISGANEVTRPILYSESDLNLGRATAQVISNVCKKDEAKISMTVPVSTKVTTLAEKDGPVQREEMGFYVPGSHQEAPPNPKGEVTIVTRPEMTVFVRTFGGFAKDKDWEEQREQLMASLRGREDFDAVNTKEYFRQGFDAPFKFWNRKNEVFLVKSD